MVKQYTESQYDDDLTLGSDDYDDSYYSDADDLFEFGTDNTSPISRLKSLVLSIDWEITDDVLRQFNEELLDLKSIWAGETINLVYVQALEKISKYIYQNKAESHPSAIKLLLTFYYNLEKIVSSSDLKEEQRKEILLEDVKRFENFKRQIKGQSAPALAPPAPRPVSPAVAPPAPKMTKAVDGESDLLNLKAIVLGIDWEITDLDLNDLRREVFRLEEKYSESRPKLILLQGLGTLAAYIKVKKSNAHPDAFKVLLHFYECLEKIVKRPMSLEEEKAILFPAVEKFNAFKALLGPTIAPESIVQKDDEDDEDGGSGDGSGTLSPALADVDEEAEVGFQADREAVALGFKDPSAVTSHIDDFFGEKEAEPPPSAVDAVADSKEQEVGPTVDLFADEGAVQTVDRAAALQGVDVGDDEEDDDLDVDEGAGITGESQLPVASVSDSSIALSELDEDHEELAAIDDQVVLELDKTEEEIHGATEAIFPDVLAESGVIDEPAIPGPDRETALQGVNVETEADDDSDELSLPMEGEELAPALASSEEESIFSKTSLERTALSGEVVEELSGTIDNLFLDEEAVAASDQEDTHDSQEDSDEQPASLDEDLAPALAWLDEPKEQAPIAKLAVADESDEPLDLFSDLTSPTDIGEELSETFVAEDLSDEAPLADKQELDVESDDAVAAFFAEDQTEHDLSMDEGDIEELFDTLESDFTADLNVKPEQEAQQADVAQFFEAAAEESSPALSHLETATGLAAVGILANQAAEPTPVLVREPPEDEREGEVVFELVEEGAEEAALTVDDDFGEKMPPPILPGESEELAGGESFAAEELLAVIDDSPALAVEPPGAQGPLAGLRFCIASLQLEMSDKIFIALLAEINGLRQKWEDRPLEKTFLQLLSTVSQHIDNYRYESSADAHDLLVATAEALQAASENDSTTGQELLLAATHKVLDWQQDMLLRQAVKKGTQLTFVDPLRTEGQATTGDGDAQEAFDSLIDQLEDGNDGGLNPTVSDVGSRRAVSANGLAEDAKGMDVAEAPQIPEALADDLKKEIAALRQTLQMEIAELRRDLKRED